ncbi:hypothetical protein FRB90_002696 [Tulasnella sp. 427]|nr:hypothetical protein FRB90_002696 [Tulasnella sp. 427]
MLLGDSLAEDGGGAQRLAFQSSNSEWHTPETHVILITPSVFDQAARKDKLATRGTALDRALDVMLNYVDMIIAPGRELNIPVVDTFLPVWKATGSDDPEKFKEYLVNEMHPSKNGYTTIKTNYPELHYDALLPMYFPG